MEHPGSHGRTCEKEPNDASGNRGLDRCPNCGYCLTGLPTTYTCPECGLVYDPGTLIIRQATLTPMIAAVMGTVSIVLPIVNRNAHIYRSVVMDIVRVLFGSYLLIFAARSFLHRNKVVLSQEGIEFIGHGGTLVAGPLPKTVRWQDISRIEVSRSKVDSEFVGHDGEIIAKVLGDFFGRSERAMEFTAAAVKWHLRYGRSE